MQAQALKTTEFADQGLFTEEQRRIITHAGGHSLTFAVAGSGKTHTLVGRVGFLLGQNIPARRIRIVAFNRKAAEEFRARLSKSFRHTLPEVSTFHSLGLSITHLFERQGWLPTLKLETRDWVEERLAREALMQVRWEQGIEDLPDPDTLDRFRHFIGLLKADRFSPEESVQSRLLEPAYRDFPAAFTAFEDARRRAGIRFFADLQYDPVAAMRKNAQARAAVENKLDQLLVDEFQDVSGVQIELLQALLGTRGQLDAVGDDSQCIYAWRGARPEFMGRAFDQAFPDATRFTLSRTFRFGHCIALAAAHLIAHNRQREDTLCVAASGTPASRIEMIHASIENAESIGARIAQWQRDGESLRECAVLVRLWAHSLGIELDLLERGIPYYKPGTELFELREVDALLGVLRLANGSLFAHPRAPDILRHLLNTPTLGLKARELSKLIDAIVAAPERATELIARASYGVNNDFHASKILERAELWSEITAWGDHSGPARVLLRYYAECTEWISSLNRLTSQESATEKMLAYNALIEWADRFRLATPSEFLAQMDDFRRLRERYKAGGEAVFLSTIHQAKGLEWDFVIVAGLETDQFPYKRAPLEEERRLAYVAMTRARRRLALAVPGDPFLEQTLGGGSTDMPGTRQVALQSISNASQFAFEAQLRTSIELGQGIERRLADPTVPMPQISADSRESSVSRRYINTLGLLPVASSTAVHSHNFIGTSKCAVESQLRNSGPLENPASSNIVAIDFGAHRSQRDRSQPPRPKGQSS